MKPEKLPTLIVLVIGFSLLIGALMAPRSYKYSIEEVNLYWGRVDSLCVEVNKRDSIIVSLQEDNVRIRADLNVSEWNHGRILAQIDILTQ